MKTKNVVIGAFAAILLTGVAMAETPTTAARDDLNSASANLAFRGQWRLHKMIGLGVYNQDNEKLGDISDLLVDQTGKIQSAILGVGGALGVGEHMVAVNFDQLKFVNQPIEAKMASSTQVPVASPKSSDAETEGTTGSAPTMRSARSVNEQWYPDHAVIDLTAEQFKAIPQFDYN